MRRNLLIAQAIAGSALAPAVLLICEARQVSSFAIPAGVDCLTLPALRKDLHGQCEPRYLDVSLQKLTAMRAQAIRGMLEAFEPDVLIVDHLPHGALGELDPTLHFLRARGQTRCVLGLRDVLESPETVQREWRLAANDDAIRAYYDAVWIYGDPAVYDQVREYHFAADIAQKVRYTGYLDQRERASLANDSAQLLASLDLPPGRLALCLVGGGQDGAALAQAFAAASLPPNTNGLILAGPFMPAQAYQRLCGIVAGNPRLRLIDFLPEPTMLLRHADRVVAMGGYNTVAELLSFQKHALIVPRTHPRREQLIRAERLSDLRLLDLLPAEAVTPAALTDWLARDLGAAPPVHERINMRGLACLPGLLGELLGYQPSMQHRQLLMRDDLLQRVSGPWMLPAC